MSPEEVRQLIRKGQMTGPTAGMAASYAQANLVVLQKDLAFDFLLFCQRNQKPCPVLDDGCGFTRSGNSCAES